MTDLRLDPHAARVLGALMEKSMATPDYYPLSLSALHSACNQKSSRDPVMQLSETEVSAALDHLASEHLIRERGGAGARVPRYAHRLDDELGLRYGFDRAQLAVLTLLLLRGPQTPGELRTRSGRLHAFADVEAVEHTLERLAADTQGPYVRRLAREAGRRESRYVELFSAAGSDEPAGAMDPEPAGAPRASQPIEAAPPASRREPLEDRLARLEGRVRALEATLERLAPHATPAHDDENDTTGDDG